MHFTEELLDEIRQKGINVAFVTLHVGLGTFRPVKEEKVDKKQEEKVEKVEKKMKKYDKDFAKESLKTIVAHFCDDIYDNYRIVDALLDDVIKDVEETADVETFKLNDVDIAFT